MAAHMYLPYIMYFLYMYEKPKPTRLAHPQKPIHMRAKTLPTTNQNL